MAKIEPYRLWNRLPDSLRGRLHNTVLFRTGRGLNDWLWRTDLYARLRYDFIWIIVSFDGFETELFVPATERPWWREYDRHGCHEPLTSRTFVELIDEDDRVWDLGSRLGYFSTLAATVNGAPGSVHTFEASISRWRFIEENNRARFDGSMQVNNVRVSDTDGTYRLKGDTYAKKHGPPDLVKMDIEGAEVDALKGMEQTIENHEPTLIVEGHPTLIEASDDGRTDEALLDFLRQHYDDIKISFDFREPDGEWEPVDPIWNDRFNICDVADKEYDYYQLLCRTAD